MTGDCTPSAREDHSTRTNRQRRRPSRSKKKKIKLLAASVCVSRTCVVPSLDTERFPLDHACCVHRVCGVCRRLPCCAVLCFAFCVALSVVGGLAGTQAGCWLARVGVEPH
jgi:hypothetical protein